MGRFNIDLLKAYVAPAIDEQPYVNLPDLAAEFSGAEHWFANYFLNSVFTGQYNDGMRPFAESMIARIQFAFSGYSDARFKTVEYAANWKVGAPGISRYLAAVAEWEGVFLNLQAIYDLLVKCFSATKGDLEMRAGQIANRIKHVSEDIRDGHLTGPGMPLWLTRNGFATIGPVMTYVEMADQIRFLANVANCISVPSEAQSRIAALYKETTGEDILGS